MDSDGERSTMLRLIVIITLAIGIAPHAQAPAEPPFVLTQLGPNVWAATSNPKSPMPSGANGGFVIGDDGVVVIDSFASVDATGNFGTETTKLLLAEIAKLTKLPVKYVVNTHYHLDHVGGNKALIDAGAMAVAHRNVRTWVRTQNLNVMGKNIKPEHKAFIEALPLPTVVYDHGVDLYLGSRVVRVQSFPGHTGGDSVVTIPDAKVAFAGDLFWRNAVPNMVDATSRLWIETLDTLTRSYSDYTFVSGHGGVGTAKEVVAFRDYLATVRTLVATAQKSGKTGDAVVQAAMPSLAEKYGQWDFFKFLAGPNLLDTDAELRGTKRVPQP
jgi:cyclase